MNKISNALFISSIAVYVASCGGGSSSSGDSSADVTQQCLSSGPNASFVNGCDFLVNANVVFGNATNIRLNVGPNGFLFNTVALDPDIVIICRAPSEPSSDSSSCS